MIASILGEQVTDPVVRGSLRKPGSLCPHHLGLLKAQGSPLSLSIIAEDLLGHWRTRPSSRTGRAEVCLVCADLQKRRANDMRLLGSKLADERWSARYAQSLGLCRTHWLEARHGIESGALERIEELESQIIAQLRQTLIDVVNRCRWDSHAEIEGALRGSWNRAINKLR